MHLDDPAIFTATRDRARGQILFRVGDTRVSDAGICNMYAGADERARSRMLARESAALR